MGRPGLFFDQMHGGGRGSVGRPYAQYAAYGGRYGACVDGLTKGLGSYLGGHDKHWRYCRGGALHHYCAAGHRVAVEVINYLKPGGNRHYKIA